VENIVLLLIKQKSFTLNFKPYENFYNPQPTTHNYKLNFYHYLCLMLLVTFSFGVQGQTPLTITSNKTWISLTPLEQSNAQQFGIIINTGFQLDIGAFTLNMSAGKSITLNSGAKLILDGTTIQATSGTTWSGIVANGAGGEQFTIFPDSKTKNDPIKWAGVLDGLQTLVKMTNITQIINAQIGVKSTSGAVIRSNGTVYTNCNIGIQIDSYRSLSKQKINACYFMKDEFIWNNTISSTFDLYNLIGIKLTNVGAINIGGCSFTNTNVAGCLKVRGTGIKAQNSDFTAEKNGDRFCKDDLCDACSDAAQNCTSVPTADVGCSFVNLYRGIDYVSLSSRNDQLITRHSHFTNNFHGMYVERCNTLGLYKNEFKTDRGGINDLYNASGCASGDDYGPGSVLSDFIGEGAHQLRILENTFTGDEQYIDHIIINRSSSLGSSLIKANTITSSTGGYDINDGVVGIVLQGNNAGLQIRCNTFNEMGVDIWNTISSTIDNQPLTPVSFHAGNDFSDIIGNLPTDRFSIFNEGNAFTHTVHTVSTPQKRKGGSSSTTWGINPTSPVCSLSCDDLTGIVNNSGLSVNSIAKTFLTVYPNPAKTRINIDDNLKLDNNAVLEFYTLEGKLVKSILLQSNSVDVTDLNQGIYTLKLINSDNSLQINTKLIIIH
jgi:hypothetical protein